MLIEGNNKVYIKYFVDKSNIKPVNIYEIIEDLYNKGLLNYIETRNIEIKLSRKTLNNLDNIISRGFHFEKEWLKKRAQFIKKVDPFLAKDYQKRIFAIIRREN